MQRFGRKHRRRPLWGLEAFEPRQLLAGLFEGSPAGVYGPLPAPVLELPQSAPPGATFSSLASNDAAWLRSQGLSGVGQTVALIDSGIAFDHVALGGGFGPGYKVLGGWDFAENDAWPYDDAPAGFHGTHIAGIVAGRDGFRSGIAPDASLVALRVFDDTGATQAAWIKSALRWVYEHRESFASPITTVNLSIGTANAGGDGALAAELEEELTRLRSANIFIAVSAGNRFNPSTPNALSYPAASPAVFPVASLDGQGRLSEFTQRNERVLAAPGENVVSTAPDFLLGADGRLNDYVAATGTSMAAPYVAAASVLVRDALRRVTGREPTVTQIEQVLREGADSVDDPYTGQSYARVQLRRTLENLLSPRVNEGVQVDLPAAPESWPAGDAWEWHGRSSPQGPAWYQWRTVRTGQVTVIATGALPGSLAAYDRQGRMLARSRSTLPGERLDFLAWEGEPIYFSIAGADGPLNIRLENLMRLDGDSLEIHDTPADDELKITLGTTLRVTLNGVEQEFASSAVRSLSFHGQAGDDSIVFDASRATTPWESTITATSAELRSTGLLARFAGFSSLDVYSGSARDEALLVDGLDDDHFQLESGDMYWSTATRRVRLVGIESVQVSATRGGEDRAYLVDSKSQDLLDIRATDFRWNVGTTNYVARGMEHLEARSRRGGDDRVLIRDSSGEDRLEAWPERISWRTATLDAHLSGFSQVLALASAGGNDTAVLHGGGGDDFLRLKDAEIAFDAQGARWVLRGFGQVTVDGGTGGVNRAEYPTGARMESASTPFSPTIVRVPTMTVRSVGLEWSPETGSLLAGDSPLSSDIQTLETDRVRAIDFLYRKLARP